LEKELFGGFTIDEQIRNAIVICCYYDNTEELFIFGLIESSSKCYFLEIDDHLLFLLEFAILGKYQSEFSREVDCSDEIGCFPDEERCF
jgi:hypothetical protein